MRDALLSDPLDRSRAPSHMYLVPRLEDGRLQHSPVDGVAALQMVNLAIDEPPEVNGTRSHSFSTSDEQRGMDGRGAVVRHKHDVKGGSSDSTRRGQPARRRPQQ